MTRHPNARLSMQQGGMQQGGKQQGGKHKGGSQKGVMLLEALIAILIFSVGILAVVGMLTTAVKTVNDSKIRSDASFLTDQLMSQVWVDAGNSASYAWDGTGTAPARLTAWYANVTSRLPNAVNKPPVVTVTGSSANGATVQITVYWQMPEEAADNVWHNHTALASVYTS